MNPANRAYKKWLPFRRTSGRATVRLFCLPPAGGAASFFNSWAALAPPEIDVCALQLPARESRFVDPPIADLQALLSDLSEPLRGMADLPVAFLGYSFGALVAFELARWTRANLGIGPRCLVACSFPPPQRIEPRRGGPPRTDEELIEVLRSFGGTPDEVLASEELRELQLPSLHADFAILDAYEYRDLRPFECPVLALWGDQDSLVSPEVMPLWAQQTRAACTAKPFSGGHFFAIDHLEATCRLVFDQILNA